MKINLEMMQIILRQMPVVIVALIVIVHLIATKQRRNSLVLERNHVD